MCSLITPCLLKNFSINDANALGSNLILSLLLPLSEILIFLLRATLYVNNLNFISELEACAE